eukprot:CAMPEP_0198259798 /NCGR_PEP_ID=MMETSP1447-20131203/8902_1 /TAXON_ID=420782 /ORGANISM="Chaetoceros dichaeta, Strain CCMP1751" /LENGTH=259 /DNA_ID=CAMNT_0043947281 /DNA_START=24 /DNA_END=803 /DNA_ORIENTATION=-
MHYSVARSCLLLLLSTVVTAFYVSPPRLGQGTTPIRNRLHQFAPLYANKQNKKKGKGKGGGFGAKSTTQDTPLVGPISADKISLEKQWDIFASVTDLEIQPLGNPDDEEYVEFEVVDVFVRCGKTETCVGTKWFRIGKICTTDGTSTEAALTLQKGLIFWTAVHMRREFMALGKAAATALELGFTRPAIIYMGSDSDGPLDDEEETSVTISEKVPLQNINAKSFGFRPDWNPPGFTYKRREKDAMKKKLSALEEILENS